MKETSVCFSLLFFCTRLIMASDAFSVSCTKNAIMGKYGSSVVLPCWLIPETDAETLQIRWYRPEQFQNPILFYDNGKIITNLQEEYRNRTSLSTGNPQSTGLKQGDVSLKLDNLGLGDIGIFHCYVSGKTSYNDNTVNISITALGSFPHLSLEHHDDSVNLSCSSCGWFPQPSLQLESASGKGHALSKQHTIYKVQENGLFCISSWVILSSSVSDKISCSVIVSKDEMRTVSLDLGAQISADHSKVWKILFALVLLCLLALIGFFLYRKYKPGYKPVSTDDPIMEDLRKNAVTITLDVENCKKDCLKITSAGFVRDAGDAAAIMHKGRGFPYELCVRGRETFMSGCAYWEVGLKQPNVPVKKSWLIGVAKASFTISPEESDFTPLNGFWFLCSEPQKGLHVNTTPEISLPVNMTPERVGVLLDYDNNVLSFYNATDGVHLFTMRPDFEGAIVPLFNPGIGDEAPLRIINPEVKTQNEHVKSASDQAGDANQHA